MSLQLELCTHDLIFKLHFTSKTNYSPPQHQGSILRCGSQIKQQYRGPCTNREFFLSATSKAKGGGGGGGEGGIFKRYEPSKLGWVGGWVKELNNFFTTFFLEGIFPTY